MWMMIMMMMMTMRRRVVVVEMRINSGFPLGGLNPSQAQECLIATEGRVSYAKEVSVPGFETKALMRTVDCSSEQGQTFTSIPPVHVSIGKIKNKKREHVSSMYSADYDNYPHVFP